MHQQFAELEQKITALETKISENREENNVEESENSDNSEQIEEMYYEIKEALDYELEMLPPEENIMSQYGKLVKRVERIQNEMDFYDEDAELDRMFPNRHDDDFDEDSMSPESVFGKD